MSLLLLFFFPEVAEVLAAAAAEEAFVALPAFVVAVEAAEVATEFAAPPMFSRARVWTGAAFEVMLRPRSAGYV